MVVIFGKKFIVMISSGIEWLIIIVWTLELNYSEKLVIVPMLPNVMLQKLLFKLPLMDIGLELL